MKTRNIVLLAGIVAGVWLLNRWQGQGGAWTVPGSQQDDMLRDQWPIHDPTYQAAYVVTPQSKICI